MRRFEDMGRGLVAITPIKAYERILTDPDALWVLHNDVVGVAALESTMPFSKHLQPMDKSELGAHWM